MRHRRQILASQIYTCASISCVLLVSTRLWSIRRLSAADCSSAARTVAKVAVRISNCMACSSPCNTNRVSHQCTAQGIQQAALVSVCLHGNSCMACSSPCNMIINASTQLKSVLTVCWHGCVGCVQSSTVDGVKVVSATVVLSIALHFLANTGLNTRVSTPLAADVAAAAPPACWLLQTASPATGLC